MMNVCFYRADTCWIDFIGGSMIRRDDHYIKSFVCRNDLNTFLRNVNWVTSLVNISQRVFKFILLLIKFFAHYIFNQLDKSKKIEKQLIFAISLS